MLFLRANRSCVKKVKRVIISFCSSRSEGPLLSLSLWVQTLEIIAFYFISKEPQELIALVALFVKCNKSGVLPSLFLKEQQEWKNEEQIPNLVSQSQPPQSGGYHCGGEYSTVYCIQCIVSSHTLISQPNQLLFYCIMYMYCILHCILMVIDKSSVT